MTTPKNIAEAHEMAIALSQYAENTLASVSDDVWENGSLYDAAYNLRASTETVMADVCKLHGLLVVR